MTGLLQVMEAMVVMEEAKESGVCPFCRKAVDSRDFHDVSSWEEFQISGLCQECQDDYFKEE